METKFGQLFTEAELAEIRKQFAYVDRDRNEDARLFFDNAGGSLRLTAAEKAFYDADLMPDASEHSNRLALELAELENRARADIRMIFNCRDGEVATGYTASQLMMYIVRLLSEHAEGTNCVTTILEHPSSFDAMTMYAEKHGRELRVARANPATGGVDVEKILTLVDKNTAILSVMAASNISGHIMDIATIAKEARHINPDMYIISDAVQHAPHGVLNPEEIGVDAMNIAPYKFFGCRGFGLMYLSARIKEYPHHKLIGRAADDWEIGSPATGQFASVSAVVDYVCGLGGASTDRRSSFVAGMERIAAHERALLELMLEGTGEAPGLRHIKGITVKMDDPDLVQRDLIVGAEFDRMDVKTAAKELEKRGIVAFERSAESSYSNRMVREFDSEGVVRLSPLHVNTPAEITQFLRVAAEVAAL